jgi:hypothetical protein
LTEEQFVKNHLALEGVHVKNPRASELIREHIEYLEQGRKLSTESEYGMELAA